MSTLAELNQALGENRDAKTEVLNLLAALGSASQIGQFYGLIVNDDLFQIGESQILFPAPKDTITVTGISSALGFVDATITLRFTVNDQQVLTAALQVDATGTAYQWRYDAIPWIGLREPQLGLTVLDSATAPVVGTYGMTTDLGPVPVTLSTQFPVFSDRWLFTAELPPDTVNIANVLQYIGGINLTAILPPGLNVAANLSVQGITFEFDPAAQSLASVQVTIASTKAWPLFGNVSVANPTVVVTVGNPASMQDRTVTYGVSGQILIGLDDGQQGIIAVGAAYPNLSVYASLDPGSPVIPLGAFLRVFATDTHVDLSADLSAFLLNLRFQRGVTYQFGAGLTTDWPIVIGGKTIFTVTGLSFDVAGSGTAVPTGSLSGTVAIGAADAPLSVTVSASYEGGDTGWVFKGQTNGALTLKNLAKTYLDIDTDLEYGVSGLAVSITPKTGAWSIAGQTDKEWQLPFTPDAGVTASVAITHDPKEGYSGQLMATVRFESIEVAISYDIKSQLFTIQWELFQATLQNKVATFRLTGVTLGGLIAKFVGWAIGTPFGLAAPWNLLDDIPLDDISLSFNFGTRQVSFGLEIKDLDFGFAKITRIGVAYAKPKVNIVLDGSFIWQSEPLKWDAADPASTKVPPGGGNKYFDLRLLMVGQHVSIKGHEQFKSVQEAIDLLRQLPATPPVEEAAAGLADPIEMVYDPNAGWLVATDFGILKVEKPKPKLEPANPSANLPMLVADDAPTYFLSLSVIFNDPNLYALRAALAGPAAKLLEGLVFEIMYQRISDTVGVYQAEITLPKAMRSFDVGAYSLTLPVFGIAVYTNGDFKVDIGFPWNMDWTRCFSVQGIIYPGIPVLGAGGLYFGKLSSSTSNQVPKTDKGHFNPVLIFGFGLRLGVGKEIDKGIFKAGLSVTVFGIIEGVIARWNPVVPATTGSSNIQDTYYFWLQGTIGILGKLFGSVDFAVVKAEVSLSITLAAQITFESFRDIPITVWAAVDISVKISIDVGLFSISISFSFSYTLKETFTITNSGKAPWDPDTLQAKQTLRLSANDSALLANGEGLTMTWSNLQATVPGVPLSGYLVPALTVHGDGAAKPADQQAAYVLLLALDSVAPLPPSGQEPSADTAFELLAKMLLRWVVAASLTGQVTADRLDDTPVTDKQLAAVMDFLTGKDPHSQGLWSAIPVEALSAFMGGQFVLNVAPPLPDDGGPLQEKHTTLFPMVPDLELLVPNPDPKKPPLLQYKFSEFNSLDHDYLTSLAGYFAKLAVQVQEEMAHQPKLMAVKDPSRPASMATFIFADYFLLLSRQLVQAARDALRDYRYPIDPGQTVQQIVNWVITEAGVPYTVAELFEANPRHLLAAGKQLRIPGIQYQVQSGDSLSGIAVNSFQGGFDVPALVRQGENAGNAALLIAGRTVTYTPPGGGQAVPLQIMAGETLSGLATRFGTDLTGLVQNSNVASQSLLQPFAVLAVPTLTYTTAGGDTLDGLAQRFGATLAALAGVRENAAIAGLFDGGADGYVDIAHLTQHKLKWLLQEIKETHGLRRLSGMASRFFLHGLRLPTKGIQPPPASPESGLYALTGQQFPIPSLKDSDTFTFTLNNPAALPWVSLGGGGKGEQ
ncbi:MAG: LysM domain protein [Firmicutes bacterium]|nr:LysM domain protein [Bacillota bacterium]